MKASLVELLVVLLVLVSLAFFAYATFAMLAFHKRSRARGESAREGWKGLVKRVLLANIAAATTMAFAVLGISLSSPGGLERLTWVELSISVVGCNVFWVSMASLLLFRIRSEFRAYYRDQDEE